MCGVRFVGAMLHAFVSRGGRVLAPEDESDVPLDAIFGRLLHENPAAGQRHPVILGPRAGGQRVAQRSWRRQPEISVGAAAAGIAVPFVAPVVGAA